HRLQRVGWTGHPQFDQRVFAELHAASGGIPRRINQIANRLLLLGAVEGRMRIDAVMLKAVLDEMAGERVAPAASTPAPEPRPEAVTPPDRVPGLLAERDGQIAELQQAVVELSSQLDAVTGAAAARPEIEALSARLARL